MYSQAISKSVITAAWMMMVGCYLIGNVGVVSSATITNITLTTDDEGCICLMIYEPVCASNGITYGNACELNCARREHPYVMGICKGECPCCKPPFFNEPTDWPGWGWGPYWHGPEPSDSSPPASTGWKSLKPVKEKDYY